MGRLLTRRAARATNLPLIAGVTQKRPTTPLRETPPRTTHLRMLAHAIKMSFALIQLYSSDMLKVGIKGDNIPLLLKSNARLIKKCTYQLIVLSQ